MATGPVRAPGHRGQYGTHRVPVPAAHRPQLVSRAPAGGGHRYGSGDPHRSRRHPLGLPLHGAGDPQRLVGRNLAEVFDPSCGVTDPALRVLDHPLHDLAGSILDLPVHAMLGTAGTAPRCYSGGIYFDDLDPDGRDLDGRGPEGRPGGLAAVAANLPQDAAAGFRDFKLKLGRGYRWMPPADGLRRDIEVTRLARERCAPGR